jgi:hypothetical protein
MEIALRTIKAKASRICIRVYPRFKVSDVLTLNYITPQKGLIRYIITYAFPAWEFAADTHLQRFHCLQKSFPHHRQFSTTYSDPRYAYSFQNSVRVQQYRNIMQQHRSHIKVTKIELFTIQDMAKPDRKYEA